MDIRSGEVLEGYLPIKKVKVLLDWLAEGDNRIKIETNFYELNPRLSPKKVETPQSKRLDKKNKKKGGK